jgi:hypothetical protein
MNFQKLGGGGGGIETDDDTVFSPVGKAFIELWQSREEKESLNPDELIMLWNQAVDKVYGPEEGMEFHMTSL